MCQSKEKNNKSKRNRLTSSPSRMMRLPTTFIEPRAPPDDPARRLQRTPPSDSSDDVSDRCFFSDFFFRTFLLPLVDEGGGDFICLIASSNTPEHKTAVGPPLRCALLPGWSAAYYLPIEFVRHERTQTTRAEMARPNLPNTFPLRNLPASALRLRGHPAMRLWTTPLVSPSSFTPSRR